MRSRPETDRALERVLDRSRAATAKGASRREFLQKAASDSIWQVWVPRKVSRRNKDRHIVGDRDHATNLALRSHQWDRAFGTLPGSQNPALSPAGHKGLGAPEFQKLRKKNLVPSALS